MNEELFCALARNLCHEVIFKMENNEVVKLHPPKLSELFKLSTPKPVFSRLSVI